MNSKDFLYAPDIMKAYLEEGYISTQTSPESTS